MEITILHTKNPYCDRKARSGGFTPLVSGREGGPHLRARRNPPQHKATCDSPRLLVAPSSSVLFSLFSNGVGSTLTTSGYVRPFLVNARS